MAVRFQNAFVVKSLVLLTLLSAEELAPLTNAHFVNTVILRVWDGPHVVEICSRLKVMRVPRLGDR